MRRNVSRYGVFRSLTRHLCVSGKDKKISSEAKARLGSFYLRVGAVAFGIGSMVYSGLEFGQYFELKGKLHSLY